MSTNDFSVDMMSTHSSDDEPDSEEMKRQLDEKRRQKEEMKRQLEEMKRQLEEKDRQLEEKDRQAKEFQSKLVAQPQDTIASIETTSTSTTPRKGVSVGTTDSARIDLGLPFSSTRSDHLLENAIDQIITEHIDYAKKKEEDPNYGNDDFHKARIAAPFQCLFQSAGYGKTRLMLEFARKYRHKVVYLLCKDLENWKVPEAVKYILRIESDDEGILEREWEKFLLCIKAAVKDVTDLNDDLYSSQITEDFKFGDFYTKVSYTSRKNHLRKNRRCVDLRRLRQQNLSISGTTQIH